MWEIIRRNERKGDVGRGIIERCTSNIIYINNIYYIIEEIRRNNRQRNNRRNSNRLRDNRERKERGEIL
jgi:hypothetical protein